MNELDIKTAWQKYDKKLDFLLDVNHKQLKEIQAQKAESQISSFLKKHVVVMLLGVLWVVFLGYLLFHSIGSPAHIYFSISVGGILLFNVFAVLLYLKHIVILSQIDVLDSIADTQRKLIQVYTSYVDSGRFLLLQTPFFCTWWYSPELVENEGPLFWTIQIVVVGALTTLAIFFFTKLSTKSKSNKWQKRSDRIFGAHNLIKAGAFLDEIETYKSVRE